MEDNVTHERQLSAIMFTDMVGYSALTQKNEKLAVELLDEHRIILRSIIGKHQGQEIEIVGDAFFVEFSSALNAVECAIEIQRNLYERSQKTPEDRRICVRIGVHVGDVIHRNKQVIGDCVNIAARMEPLADPGGICLSEDVARQIQNKIEFSVKSLGMGELKNIRIPIKIFKVVLPWEKRSPIFHSPKLIFNFKKTISVIVTSIIILLLVVIYANQSFISFVDTFTVNSNKWPTDRLAVLPFDNYSPNSNDEYISDGFYVHPIYLSIIYLALNDRDEALNWLEKGYEDRSEWMIYLQVEHMLDPLRSEVRFKELVKKMKFKNSPKI